MAKKPRHTPPLFRGIIPALFTPFTKDGKLDAAAVAELVEYHVSLGVGGLYICGSTGEGTAKGVQSARAGGASRTQR